MTGKTWTVESSRTLVLREPWLEVFEERVRLPDGRSVPDFYTIRLRDYVVVVAVTADGQVVTERHYRHGSGAVTTAVPCGFLDDGETALDAAQRELREETGYEAASWRSLGRFVVDGNRGCGWANVFLAEGAHQVAAPAHSDLAEIEVGLSTFADLFDGLRSGGISELACAAGLGLAAIEARRSALPGMGAAGARN